MGAIINQIYFFTGCIDLRPVTPIVGIKTVLTSVTTSKFYSSKNCVFTLGSGIGKIENQRYGFEKSRNLLVANAVAV